MFLIYINDICKAVPNAKVKLYADDTNLFLFDTDGNNLNIKANTSLKELNTWLEINKVESVQRRFTKRLPCFHDMEYSARLDKVIYRAWNTED